VIYVFEDLADSQVVEMSMTAANDHNVFVTEALKFGFC
jgi:hypothetical protein